MEIGIAYGKAIKRININKKNVIEILSPDLAKPVSNVRNLIKLAIKNSIGTPPLEQIVKPEHKIVFIVDDITRPTPTKQILQPLLESLENIGVPDKNILIIFALGVHRKMNDFEMEDTLGEEIFNRFHCINHDAFDETKLVDLGITKFGTPVYINKKVVEADTRILTGIIKPHNLAGYSGGAKSILPGVCGEKTILYNHSFKTQSHPYSRQGIIEKNPLRKDIEETIKKLGVTYIVNLILDYKQNVYKVVAGDYIEAHRKGAKYCNELTKKKVSKQADICICGTPFPFDINVYQMVNSFVAPYLCPHPIIKKGGIIICAGEALAGISDGDIYESIVNASSFEEIYKQIQKQDCKIKERAGVQFFCELLMNYTCYIVSDIKNKEKLENIGFKYYDNLQKAIDRAIHVKGEKSRITILPYAPCVITDFVG